MNDVYPHIHIKLIEARNFFDTFHFISYVSSKSWLVSRDKQHHSQIIFFISSRKLNIHYHLLAFLVLGFLLFHSIQ